MKRRARFEARPDQILLFSAESILFAFEAPEAEEYRLEGDAAVVEVRGPLVQHCGGFWCSYDELVARVTSAAADAKALRVILKIDSPGGVALGCFECARSLRAVCEQAGKPLIAYCDGMIASAAYALACAASKIYTPEAAEIGSIGVLRGRPDYSQMDAMMGIRWTFAASGLEKLDMNPAIPMSEDAAKRMQAKVEEFAELFYSFVGEMRPSLSADAVRALEAATMLGKRAVAKGLADGVCEWGELIAMVGMSAAGSKEESNMDKKEMRAWLSKLAEKDDEDGKKAKAALKAMDDEEKDDKEKKDKEAKAKAEADDKEKKEKDDKEAKAKALALATSSGDVATIAKIAGDALQAVHGLEARMAEREKADADKAARAALLATRPDFSPNVRASLEAMPIAFVKDACEKWERSAAHPANAALVQGTAGRTQTGDGSGGTQVRLSEDEQKAIANGFGDQAIPTGLVRSGSKLEMGFMTPAMVNEAAKRLNIAKEGA